MTDIAGERRRLADVGLRIEHRETWGARQDYSSARAVDRPASWLFLHIAVIDVPSQAVDSERKAMRLIESIGQDRFGIGWSYNAAACQSGRLYEGQPLTRRGAHTVNDKPNPNFPQGSLNRSARALVLPQNVGDAVTDLQIDAAARWGAALQLAGEAVRGARWYGHRDVTYKDCPGQKAYDRLGDLNWLTAHYVTNGLGAGTGDDSLSAAEVAEIKAHIDGQLKRVVHFLTSGRPDTSLFTGPAAVSWMDDPETVTLNEVMEKANLAAFFAKLAFDLANPNGFGYVDPTTGKLVPQGTAGSVPASDFWRWARESVTIDREDDDRHSALMDAIEALAALHPEPEEPPAEPEPEPSGEG